MRVKTMAQRKRFIKIAGKLFSENGLAAVSMEAIAHSAECSKVTLYNYFSSKEDIFKEFVLQAGSSSLSKLTQIAQDPLRITEKLFKLATLHIKIISSKEVVNLNRLMIAEAYRYPDLAQIYYDNGPRLELKPFMMAIESAIINGELVACDSELAALQFKSLCQLDLIDLRLWSIVKGRISKENPHVLNAIDIFMQVYGKPARPS